MKLLSTLSILNTYRILCVACTLLWSTLSTAAPPNLMLANSYHNEIDLTQYWVSEKLDGVRAYWDGAQLVSRQGTVFAAPDWFIAQLPPEPLDGELWMGRGQFEPTSAAVRRLTPQDDEWRIIRLMVFDMPQVGGDFDQRLQHMRALFATLNPIDTPNLALIEQEKLPNQTILMQRLDTVVRAGGEGLMLHLGSAPYRGLRSDDLLKLKPFDDAEATVLAHIAGQGKYRGMLGALLMQTDAGVQFKIGTGLSDAQRRNPPPIGTVITYRYRGVTVNGVPRFASFMRVRN